MKRAGAALIVLAALLCAGCGAKAPDHPEELKIQVMKFLREVELKDYDGAASRVHPNKRAAFVSWITNDADKIHFTNSQIRVLPTEEELEKMPEDKPKKANVIVSLEYFRLPSTVVKKEVRTQVWLFDEDYDRWYLLEGWEP